MASIVQEHVANLNQCPSNILTQSIEMCLSVHLVFGSPVRRGKRNEYLLKSKQVLLSVELQLLGKDILSYNLSIIQGTRELIDLYKSML